MRKIYVWKCRACGATLDSEIETLHVHSNGHNGRAYFCDKVGVVTEYTNPPYNTRYKWRPLSNNDIEVEYDEDE